MRYEAFVDGSYKEDVKLGVALYSSAAIIAPEGTSKWTSIVQCGCEPEYLKHHNTAGEIFAAMQVCEYCLNTLKLTPDDCLKINYDYAGIANWLRKPNDPDYWKQKSELAKIWRTYFYQYVKPRFKVEFSHTPGHTGIQGNELVDELAKDAVNKRFRELVEEKRGAATE